jgi:hypothetical protein
MPYVVQRASALDREMAAELYCREALSAGEAEVYGADLGVRTKLQE